MNLEELSESDGESSEELEQNVADEGSSADSDDDAMTQSSVEGWRKVWMKLSNCKTSTRARA